MVLTAHSSSRNSRRDPRFALHYTSWLPILLKLIPGAVERSGVSLSDEEVRVRMRPGGEIRIPRDSINRVWRTKAGEQGLLFWLPPIGGAHSNFRGVWWMNGSTGNLVAIDIDPPATGSVWGISIRPRRVIVSLEDPAGFVDELLG